MPVNYSSLGLERLSYLGFTRDEDSYDMAPSLNQGLTLET